MIVVDASWVVALRDPQDVHHGAASEIERTTAHEDMVVHPVTLAQCLVAPARLGVLEEAATRMRAAFDEAPIDDDAPLRWAAVRARTGLRLPDAIVLDTALQHGARAVATFDDRLATAARAAGLNVLDGRSH